MSYIDPARCTDCGACMAACVVQAIYPADDVPRASREFIHINASWFGHKRGVRQRVAEIADALGIFLPPSDNVNQTGQR